MDYQAAYDQAAPSYQPQFDTINAQLADLPRQQQAQMTALDQAKVNAFKDITNSANSKGVLFSGVPIDQQATYTGTKYLPAVANLQTSFNNTQNQLQGQKNTLIAQRDSAAKNAVAAYQKDQEDRYYKDANLQLGYARVAASNAKAAQPKPLSQQQTSAAILQGLGGVRGSDGYVAPQDYAAAFKDWTQAGFNASSFDNYFGHLKNPDNPYYDYAITQAK